MNLDGGHRYGCPIKTSFALSHRMACAIGNVAMGHDGMGWCVHTACQLGFKGPGCSTVGTRIPCTVPITSDTRERVLWQFGGCSTSWVCTTNVILMIGLSGGANNKFQERPASWCVPNSICTLVTNGVWFLACKHLIVPHSTR